MIPCKDTKKPFTASPIRLNFQSFRRQPIHRQRSRSTGEEKECLRERGEIRGREWRVAERHGRRPKIRQKERLPEDIDIKNLNDFNDLNVLKKPKVFPENHPPSRAKQSPFSSRQARIPARQSAGLFPESPFSGTRDPLSGHFFLQMTSCGMSKKKSPSELFPLRGRPAPLRPAARSPFSPSSAA